MIAWRIYYDDGSTFDSSQGSPAQAPAWGVECVVQRDTMVGRTLQWPEVLEGRAFFVWNGEMWDCKDLIGLMDFLANFPGCVVRFGRTVQQNKFREIYARAMSDPDFPKKSAYEVGERKP